MTPKLPPQADYLSDSLTDSMHAYGLACYQQGLEGAAKICDDLAARDELSNYYKVAALAIRKEITP